MSQYLLDTDVSINYLRGFEKTIQKVLAVGTSNICLSEITLVTYDY